MEPPETTTFAARLPVCFLALLTLTGSTAFAQVNVTVDGTLGPAGALPGAAGKDVEIPAAAGRLVTGQGRTNLFHSFDKFSIRSDESASFTGPANLDNIVGRVTGTDNSIINGRLISAPAADLTLINPNGIIIAPGAQLSVNGSFYASTADALHLSDGGVFFADPNAQSSLTAAAPSAFGFLAETPADILLDGAVLGPTFNNGLGPGEIVKPGGTFALIGGNIRITGITEIGVPGGDFKAVSVASPGEVKIKGNKLEPTGFAQMGEFRMDFDSEIDVSDNFGGGASGNVFIRSGQFVLDDGGLISAFTVGDGAPGTIDIHATHDVAIVDRGAQTTTIDTGSEGFGAGPAVNIEAGENFIIDGPAAVFSAKRFVGDAGDINVRAKHVRLTGGALITGDNFDIEGAGPRVSVAADTIELSGGSGIKAEGLTDPALGATNARAGDVMLRANSLSLTDDGTLISTKSDFGSSGNIDIIVSDLTVNNGARISATTGGAGAGGATVSVIATNSASLSGERTAIFSSTIGLDADVGSAGNAGSITVMTGHLSLDGARIDSSTFGDGEAGKVDVHAGSLELEGGAQIRSLAGGIIRGTDIIVGGTGNAGNVNVQVDGTATLGGASSTGAPTGILSETRLGGHGGKVRVRAGELVVQDGAVISAATAGDGAGGNVDVKANTVRVRTGGQIRSDSGIMTSGFTLLGNGSGGDVRIRGDQIFLSDGGRISASSLGAGLAGNIEVLATDRVELRDSSIATQALEADGGNITVNAPNLVYLANSEFTTSVESGFGAGGNINIDPEFVVLQNSRIIANAFGGPGGNIRIVANNFIADPNSVVEASSARNIDGNVVIEAPDTDISSSVTVLPSSFFDASSLLKGVCDAARDVGANSLVSRGRGGVPAGPDTYITNVVIDDADVSANAYGETDDTNVVADTTSTADTHEPLMLAGLSDIIAAEALGCIN